MVSVRALLLSWAQVGVADRATDELLDMLVLDKRDPNRPGHVTDTRDEQELS